MVNHGLKDKPSPLLSKRSFVFKATESWFVSFCGQVRAVEGRERLTLSASRSTHDTAMQKHAGHGHPGGPAVSEPAVFADQSAVEKGKLFFPYSRVSESPLERPCLP